MDRKCTDVFICLLFFIFFCGMFATAAYGYAWGDPSKLISPFDTDGTTSYLKECIGNQCGKGKTENFKYLVWPDITNIKTNPKVIDYTICVKDCPKFSEQPNCFANSKYPDCGSEFFYPTT